MTKAKWTSATLCLILLSSSVATGCAQRTGKASLASAKGLSAEAIAAGAPNSSLLLNEDEIKIKSYPASKEVNYVDIDAPVLNKSDKLAKFELISSLYPASEPDHLVSWLRTRIALEANESKIIQPKISVVRPPEIKNGVATKYKLKLQLVVEGKEIEAIERVIDLTY